jgi:hypothetical protein
MARDLTRIFQPHHLKYSAIIAGDTASQPLWKQPKAEPIEIDLRGYHPLVVATKRSLDQDTPDGFGLLEARLDGTVKIRVSRDVAPRALTILQTVVAEVENRGWTIRPREGDTRPAICVRNEAIEFYLIEQSKLIKHKAAGVTWRVRVHKPNGKLRLGFDCMSDPKIDRKSWGDGNAQKLEDFIGEFLNALGNAAEVVLRWHQKIERNRRKTERQRLRVEEEAARRQELAEQAIAFQRVANLRRLIAELQQKCAAEPRAWNLEAVERWIMWAEALINRSDPFLNGYFDRILKVKRFYPEIDLSKEQPGYGYGRSPYTDPFVSPASD